jgi:hypothetical protein
MKIFLAAVPVSLIYAAVIVAFLIPITVNAQSFSFTVNHGMTGSVAGITVNTSQVKLQTGPLTSGNPPTAATFATCETEECFIVPGEFHGTWSSQTLYGTGCVWQEVGSTSSYTITGTVTGNYEGKEVNNVPVVITVNNVVFTSTGWSN